MARSITDPDEQVRALAAVAGALAEAGQHEEAETVARSITDPDEQVRALAAVAGVLAEPASMRRPRPWPAPSPTRAGRRRR